MNPDLALSDTFEKLGIALGLGLLVGIQRERTDSRLAGIRTFPLTTVLGTITGLLALRLGGWVVAAGLLGVATLLIIGNLGNSQAPPDRGITTEVAMLLMFGVGAYLVSGYAPVAVALGGTIAVLLHLKPEMHAFARKMGDKDFRAIMQFVLITLVILPVLPDKEYGPFHVLNPFKVWLLVVLIVGMRLAGYVAHKYLGAKGGAVLSGVLGGLISSTATTVSYARQAREAPESSPMATLVIMVASTVLYIRILVIVAIVAAPLFLTISVPLGAMLGVAILITGGLWLVAPKDQAAQSDHENPSELKPALLFAALFVLVRFGVEASKRYFGTQGLYAVAFVSGLPDLDAITLSTLQSANQNQLDAGVAWRMILLASLANLIFKAATVAVMGNRKLLARIAVPFGVTLVAGCLILWRWPR